MTTARRATLLLELEMERVVILFSCMRTITAKTRDVSLAVPDVANALRHHLNGEAFRSDLLEIVREACDGDHAWCWTLFSPATTFLCHCRDDRLSQIKVTARLVRKDREQRRHPTSETSFLLRLAQLLQHRSRDGQWSARDVHIFDAAAEGGEETLRFHPLFEESGDRSPIVTSRIIM